MIRLCLPCVALVFIVGDLELFFRNLLSLCSYLPFMCIFYNVVLIWFILTILNVNPLSLFFAGVCLT